MNTFSEWLMPYASHCTPFSQIIALSASANKLAKLKDQAEEYAALIMEELDPDNLGYIEVVILLSRLL